MAVTNESTEGGPLIDLTKFQRDMLFALAGLEEPSGQDIKHKLEVAYERELHHGRIYPALDALVQLGLVDKSSKDKRTNCYQVSSRGRREIEADLRWRRSVVGDLDE